VRSGRVVTVTAQPDPNPNAKDDAQMNLWSVTAMGIGAMVGAGIFALLGQAALVAGNYTYLAFLLGGIVAALSGYSYAKLATRYPDGGAITAYFDHAFGTGRLAGTLSLIYLITLTATVAMVAKAFGAYAAPLIGGGGSRLWIDGFASGIVILLALLNIARAGLVGKAEIVLVAIKLVILTTLMVAGSIGMIGKPAIAHPEPGFIAVISSVGLTFFAYAGFGMMANAAGSVAHPKRTIPRAIFLAISVVVVLYVGLALIVLGTVSFSEIAQHADTAVAEAAKPVLGHIGFVIVSLGALLATASAINAYVFAAMKIASALAKAGQLPRMFGRRIWRDGTPGILLGFGGILLAVNLFDLSALAHIASATFLIVYLAVHVAHWRLIDQTNAYRLPVALGFLSMALVLAIFLWTTASTQPWSVGLIALFIAGSGAVEVILKKKGYYSASANCDATRHDPA
jgi:amino acid transporter